MTNRRPRHPILNGCLRAAAVALCIALAASPSSSLAAAGRPHIGLLCDRLSDGAGLLLRAPSRCVLMPPRASLADAWNLVDLRWEHHWGERVVEGTGYSIGFQAPYRRVTVAVAAYRPRKDSCGDGLVLYTRVLINWGSHYRIVEPQSCDGAL